MPASPLLRRLGSGAVETASRALGAFALIAVLLTVMWALEIADYTQDGALDRFGLRAHDFDDLPDIFTAPFLHAGFDHLIGNSIPFAVLGFLAAVRGIFKFLAMNLIVIVIAGIGVWFTGPPDAVTLGASILVFGYFGYLVGRGLFERSVTDALLALAVIVVYGGIIYGILPTDLPISWQGHLFGLIGGLVSSYVLRRKRIPVPRSAPPPVEG
ncbi:rhomboid family intramembrane serine protease [Actinocorallia lasiicapitis]